MHVPSGNVKEFKFREIFQTQKLYYTHTSHTEPPYVKICITQTQTDRYSHGCINNNINIAAIYVKMSQME